MKRHVTITMEDFIHDQAKAKGVNMSAVCEDAIRERLGSFNTTILPENCTHEWTYPFSVPSGLAKQCKRCGIFKRTFLEGTSDALFESINKCWVDDKDVNEKKLIDETMKEWKIDKKDVQKLIDSLEVDNLIRKTNFMGEDIIVKPKT